MLSHLKQKTTSDVILLLKEIHSFYRSESWLYSLFSKTTHHLDLQYAQALYNVLIFKKIEKNPCEPRFLLLLKSLQEEEKNVRELILQAIAKILKKHGQLPIDKLQINHSPLQILIWGYLKSHSHAHAFLYFSDTENTYKVIARFSNAQLIAFHAALNIAGINKLKIGQNNYFHGFSLNNFSPDEFEELCLSINRSQLKIIDLTFANIYLLKEERLKKLFTAINHVKTLTLSYNHLYLLQDEEWKLFLLHLSTLSIKHLDCTNAIYSLRSNQWEEFLSTLEKLNLLEELILKDNLLYQPSRRELLWRLLGLNSLKSLDISDNLLDTLEEQQQQLFLDHLQKSNLISLSLGKNTLQCLTTSFKEKMQAILIQNKRRHFITSPCGLKNLLLHLLWNEGYQTVRTEINANPKLLPNDLLEAMEQSKYWAEPRKAQPILR